MDINTIDDIPQTQLYLDIDIQRQKIDALPEPRNAEVNCKVKQSALVTVIEVPPTESAQQSLATNGWSQKDTFYIIDYDVKAETVNILEPIVPLKREAIFHFSEDIIVDMPENTTLHKDMVQMASTSEITVTSDNDDDDDDVLCSLNTPSSSASSISRDNYHERNTLAAESMVEEEDNSWWRDPSNYRVLVLYMIMFGILSYIFKTFVIDLPMSNE